MKGRKNVLLIELIAVIFFFAISTVVTVQVFYEANRQSRINYRTTCALVEIESWAERFSMLSNPDDLSAEWGAPMENGMYRLDSDDEFFITLKREAEVTGAGVITRFTLSAYDARFADTPLLVSLPVDVYFPGSGESA